jgi:hypothetical protein
MLRKEAGLKKAEECKHPDEGIYGDEDSEPKTLEGEKVPPLLASGGHVGVRAGGTIARREPEA